MHMYVVCGCVVCTCVCLVIHVRAVCACVCCVYMCVLCVQCMCYVCTWVCVCVSWVHVCGVSTCVCFVCMYDCGLYVHVCVYICVQACACYHACRGQRLTSGIFLNHLHFFWGHGLSLNVELADLAGLAGQHVPRIQLSLGTAQHWDTGTGNYSRVFTWGPHILTHVLTLVCQALCWQSSLQPSPTSL